MTSRESAASIVAAEDVAADTRRGGEIRTLLSPRSVGSTSGFMGVASIAPGDWIAEHYHPYSEEFVFVVAGTLTAEIDGHRHELGPSTGLHIHSDARHRFVNAGETEVRLVFHLGPLAPRPELGHVDTEQRTAAAGAEAAGSAK